MPANIAICPCGAEFHKMNRVHRYCFICQSIRDSTYSPKKSKNCMFCGKEFWPVKRSYHVCADCYEPNEDAEAYEACQRCSRHKRPMPGTSKPVCMSCVQSSPAVRKQWVDKVIKERAS